MMGVSPEVLERLQRRIDELARRMQVDSNDLDYETHLRQKRELQRMLDRLKNNGSSWVSSVKSG